MGKGGEGEGEGEGGRERERFVFPLTACFKYSFTSKDRILWSSCQAASERETNTATNTFGPTFYLQLGGRRVTHL